MAKETTTQKLDTIVEKIAEVDKKLEVHLTDFRNHVERETERGEQIKANTTILQANTSSLEQHMARTDALETFVKQINERFTPVELESIRKKAVVEWWKGKIVLLGKIGAAIGAVGAIAGILKFMLLHTL